MTGSDRGHPCWPSPLEEQILLACFRPQERASAALKKLPAGIAPWDSVPPSLLALLSRRVGEGIPDKAVQAKAHYARITIWRKNQRRFLMALSVAGKLAQAGVPCLFLKGVALILCHYGDAGLRSMEDFDLLVRPADVGTAAGLLEGWGWHAEGGACSADIVRQRRVHHAWQFNRTESESCDLHWHPVVRCYSPRVHDQFWRGSVETWMLEKQVRVPCATDQLFHVCAHGLQWSWTPQIRWIPDALIVLETSPSIDWDRLRDMATEAGMSIRLAYALQYLRDVFGASVPDAVIHALNATSSRRAELKEYALLQKECPLGLRDRMLWHTTHFARIRRFDANWSGRQFAGGLLEYLSLFLNCTSAWETARTIWKTTSQADRFEIR